MPKIPELTQSSRVKFFSAAAPRANKAAIGRGLQQLGNTLGNTAIALQRANASMKAADKSLEVGKAREDMRTWLIQKSDQLAVDGSDGIKDTETLSKEYDDFYLNQKDNYNSDYIRDIEVEKQKMFNTFLPKVQVEARTKQAKAITSKIDVTVSLHGNTVRADPTQLVSQILAMRGTLTEGFKALEMPKARVDEEVKRAEKRLVSSGIDGWVQQKKYDKARDMINTFRGRFDPKDVKKSLDVINKQEHEETMMTLSMDAAQQKRLDKLDKDRRDKIAEKFIFEASSSESLKGKMITLEKARELGKAGIIKYENMKDILSGDSTLMKRKTERSDFELESVYSHKNMTPIKMKDVVLAYVKVGALDMPEAKRWLQRLNTDIKSSTYKGTKSDSDKILLSHLLPKEFASASFLWKSDDTMKLARAKQYRTQLMSKGGIDWEEAAYIALQQFAPGPDIAKFVPGIPAKNQKSLEALDAALPRVKALFQSGQLSKEQYRDNLLIFKERKNAYERKEVADRLESINAAIPAAKAAMEVDIPGLPPVESDEYIQIPYAPNQGE